MITYNCDVCNKEIGNGTGSGHQVDRYQMRLDLCTEHVGAFVDHAAGNLAQVSPRALETNHALARAFMDALVIEGSQVPDKDGITDGPKPEKISVPQPPNMQQGVQVLHSVVNSFIEREQKAIKDQATREKLTVVSSEDKP